MTGELFLEWERDEKRARVMKRNNRFEIDFFEKEEQVGTIEYGDKSLRFVEDAAENWVTGIMTVDTINKYNIA